MSLSQGQPEYFQQTPYDHKLIGKKTPTKPKSSTFKEKKIFFKYYPSVNKALGSMPCAILFAALEYRFKIKPDGFYKFLAPCNNDFYSRDDSLCEELDLSRHQLKRLLNKLVCSYKSKSLYLKAVEESGEEGAFRGMPYISYTHHGTHQTFYLRNASIASEIYAGTAPKTHHASWSINAPRIMDAQCATCKEHNAPCYPNRTRRNKDLQSS